MAESIVTLRVDTRNAVSSLNNASLASKKLSTAAKGTTTSLYGASSAATGLGASLATALGPLIAVSSAVTLLGRSLGVFQARERDAQILLQGLNNLGAGAHSLKELQKEASRLGDATLFSQDDFTRGFALLTSFRNIGVDSYSKVAEEAANIAQINNVDVSTSFMQLAKALQDPERNLSTLNRSGISFNKTQTETIKQLMKTNKTAEAHAMILKIVEESYDKAAIAAGKGFAGRLDELSESFDDLSESIGRALLPVLDPAVKGLTALLNFLNSEGGQVTAIIAGIALAAKGISVVMPLAVTGLANFVVSTQAVAISSALGATGLKGMAAASFLAAGGITKATIAVHAFKIALIKTGIGALVVGLGFLATAFLKAKNANAEFNQLLESGTAANISKEIENTQEEINKLEESLTNITRKGTEGRSRKLRIGREIKDAKEDLDKLKSSLEAAEARELTIAFNTQVQNIKNANEELRKQNKISEEITEEAKIRKEHELAIAAIEAEFEGDQAKKLKLLQDENLKHKLNTLEIKKQQDNAKKLAKVYEEIGRSIAEGVSDALVDAVLQTKSLAQAANALLNDIARQLLRLGINTALSTFGGPFAALPTFAAGGKPPVGRASIVGEKGPELFVPSVAGTIIPNHSLGGASITNNIVVNVDASGSNVEGNEQQSRELGLVLSTAIQAQLIQEKRPGGLLA